MNNKNDQSERELVRELLNSKSYDQSGNEVLLNGKPLTNKGRVYYGLMKAAAKGNTHAAELLLKQGGMIEVDVDEDEDPAVIAERKRKNKKKTEDMLRYYKNRIKTILTEAGVYEARQEFQIEICATSIMSYRKIRQQYLDPDEPCYITELSREGMPRKKANPLAAELRNEGAALAANLSKLTMNIKDAKEKSTTEDNLTKLLDEFKDDD